MERIKVAVSPFYGGDNWTDEATGVTFEKNARGMNVYAIPSHLDLSGIRKAIRLNALVLVEGNVGDFNEVEEIIVEEPKTEEAPAVEAEPEVAPVEEAPAEEPAAEEPVMEAKAEAPKKPARKRAPKK